MRSATPRNALLAFLLAFVPSAVALLPAAAHHGWTWAVDEQSTLEGTIEEISMAPPHPTLRVKDAAGTI